MMFHSPKVIKLVSCSTHLSMKYHLLIKTKTLKNKDFPALKFSDNAFIMLTNVKMPTFVGI